MEFGHHIINKVHEFIPLSSDVIFRTYKDYPLRDIQKDPEYGFYTNCEFTTIRVCHLFANRSRPMFDCEFNLQESQPVILYNRNAKDCVYRIILNNHIVDTECDHILAVIKKGNMYYWCESGELNYTLTVNVLNYKEYLKMLKEVLGDYESVSVIKYQFSNNADDIIANQSRVFRNRKSIAYARLVKRVGKSSKNLNPSVVLGL